VQMRVKKIEHCRKCRNCPLSNFEPIKDNP
jgi:hypothetical protein